MTMRLRLLAPLLAAALIAAGCSESGESPAPDVLRVGLPAPASTNPADVHDDAGRLVTSALWTPLADYDPATGKTTPRAAESISSADRTTWTVKLKDGGKFHDGTPVTAQSYVDTWKAVEQEGWQGSRVLKGLLRAKEITAPDPLTIRLVLDRPSGQIPALLSSPALVPLPASALASRDWARFFSLPVGNGPFRLEGGFQPTGAKLVRVADAPGKARVIELKIGDATALYDGVKSGKLDLSTVVPGERHDAMHADFAQRHVMWALPNVSYLGFPLTAPHFSDATVRHGFALGVDRAALEAGVLDRQVDPAKSLLPPAVAPGERSSTCRPCTFDAGAGKSLLTQAEFPAAPVHFGQSQSRWLRPLAEQTAKAAGVPLAPEPGQGPFAIDLDLVTPSPQEVLTKIVELTGYQSDGFADLLKSAEETEAADSGEVYRLVENQLLRDLPVAPLWSGHEHAVWAERVGEVKATTFGGVDLSAVTVR
ncbi:peptide ABC transporter substrate-binding protein [Amycolatopsis thailandensis]|uniref:Peptide ABC transporter substrate-binding protein n=1 Tax=Amycolatopsis thailandensis TaxID=589330 RepID=A0A229SDE5_9PSEU|nr:ABC transporter substrate-binding protein [Amycolatopsis thailandensis]OXM56644.1 peptide ABC transporter substrate-binding protein [Amycolatopsis thailandensis]